MQTTRRRDLALYEVKHEMEPDFQIETKKKIASLSSDGIYVEGGGILLVQEENNGRR